MTLLIVPPLPFAAIGALQGSGAGNLVTHDPREVWAVTVAAGVISIDLGVPRTIDTVFLGYVRPPTNRATWAINGGLSAPDDEILPTSFLRVPDVTGQFAETSHALWHGDPVVVRYLAIAVSQSEGAPLTIGRAIVGAAFVPELGKEWGSGRRPIDTGSVTALASGGFATVEGVRKRYFGWTFGDLSIDETEQLELIAEVHGETIPLLVVDDPAPTAGLRKRILCGRFDRWKAPERRNRAQTRWEIGFEEWL